MAAYHAMVDEAQPEPEGSSAAGRGCRVLGAGCSTMNGWYALDGEYEGMPRYKHETEDLYIRYGGHMFRGYGISPGRESVRGHWAYFCKSSHKRGNLNDVPHLGQWETHGGFEALDPPPTVLVAHNSHGSDHSGEDKHQGHLTNREDSSAEQPDPNSYCMVLGAGCDRMNGMYYLDGTYQDKPRYRHATETDLFIRVGGRIFWGYGITKGREPVPGGWAYFCETSHNKPNMLDVPDMGKWVTHGEWGAVDPPPDVTVKPREESPAKTQEAKTPEAAIPMDVSPIEPTPPPSPMQLYLEGAWAVAGDLLWDGTQDAAVTGLCVLIQGDRIHSVCSIEEAHRLQVPLQQFDGCCLMPGLIDAHVHVEFDEDHPLHEQPVLSQDQLFANMAERARRMVCAGITSARDLGGRNYAALTLRDEIRAGRVPGPRFVCAGQPITSPGGHCHQWGGAVSSMAEAKAAVRRQHQNGADWIKVMATGGMRTPGTNVEAAQFSKAGLQEIVAEAKACGMPVAAHAHGTAGVIAAVAAGCNTVEHCTWIANGQWGSVDDATVEEMAHRGICVAPTAHAGWRSKPMGERAFQRMAAALQRLKRAGIPLLASSDAGAIRYLPHDRLAGGVQILAAMAQLTTVEALRAATSVCAKAIGLEDVCGRLAPGLSADLLMVSGDPTQDLSALGRPILVVAAGQLVSGCFEPPPRAPATYASARKTASGRFKEYANAKWGALRGK